jgi:hypothetical protein
MGKKPEAIEDPDFQRVVKHFLSTAPEPHEARKKRAKGKKAKAPAKSKDGH